MAQQHVDRTVWMLRGPHAGQMLVLPNEEADRGVAAGWAEDIDGKSAFDLGQPVIGTDPDWSALQEEKLQALRDEAKANEEAAESGEPAPKRMTKKQQAAADKADADAKAKAEADAKAKADADAKALAANKDSSSSSNGGK